jgi:hypothetical protein
MYYFSIHLLYTSLVGVAASLLGATWIAGASIMLMRLISRVRSEGSEGQAPAPLKERDASNSFADGVPFRFVEGHSSPSVRGILFPSILLPAGIDRMLNQREFHAVLIHELAHARRRDNLIRLLYEFLLSVLWLHPLIWLGHQARAWTSAGFSARQTCRPATDGVSRSNRLIASQLSPGAPGRAGTTGTPRSKPSTDVAIYRCHRGRRLCHRCTYRLLLRTKTLTFA